MINLKSFLKEGDERTLKAKKNIAVSFGLKGISILTSLLIVPITINYVNPTQYGIWLTISSIILWFGYFDMGFFHGLRNKFAESKAKGNDYLAACYVSTTYAFFILIFGFIWLCAFAANYFMEWSNILNIDGIYNEELSNVFGIIISFFCLQMITNIITIILTADQKNALSSCISTTGQVISLITVYILTKTTTGSLSNLAWALAIPPAIIPLFASIYYYRKRYKEYMPSFKKVQIRYASSILSLGSKFFFISISMLLIFQCTNLILVRTEGSGSVTIYNILFKYYNAFNMLIMIIYTPFWSAFTEAYTKEDFSWMKNAYSKLTKVWTFATFIIIIAILISPYIFNIWVGSEVKIPFIDSLLMGIYMITATRSNLYMTLLNGMGRVKIQTIIYIGFAIAAIPLLIQSIDLLGIVGGILTITILQILQILFGHIQLQKVLSQKARGIWNK